jgi:peptidoglycan hydrolase CwlO-like protein
VADNKLSELRAQVERAAKLIAELREANYSLKSEVAELHLRLEVGESSPPSAPIPAPSAEEAGHEELQKLRDERKIIRAKVQSLLERIERLDLGSL